MVYSTNPVDDVGHWNAEHSWARGDCWASFLFRPFI